MNDERTGFAWSVAVLAFWAAWFASSALHLPLWWYVPLEHRFVWSGPAPVLGICLYGQLLLAGPASAASGGVTWLLVRRRDLGRAQVWLSVGWCAVLLCFVIGYFAFALWGRVLSAGTLDGG